MPAQSEFVELAVAREIGGDGVFFAGWHGHEDLALALAASDAIVLPSVNDSYRRRPSTRWLRDSQ